MDVHAPWWCAWGARARRTALASLDAPPEGRGRAARPNVRSTQPRPLPARMPARSTRRKVLLAGTLARPVRRGASPTRALAWPTGLRALPAGPNARSARRGVSPARTPEHPLFRALLPAGLPRRGFSGIPLRYPMTGFPAWARRSRAGDCRACGRHASASGRALRSSRGRCLRFASACQGGPVSRSRSTRAGKVGRLSDAGRYR